MRILLTSPTYPPFNSGLGNAVAQQALGLSQAGHNVVVATGGAKRESRLDQNICVELFPVSGADCLLQPIKGAPNTYLDFLRATDWDVLLLNAWQNWATDLALRHLNELQGRKFVYSHCISTNIFFLHRPVRSLIRYLAWRPYWWRLPRVMQQLDGVLFLAGQGSDSRFDDLRLAHKYRVPLHVIPNSLSPGGVKASMSLPRPLSERDRLIAVGSYQWQKGFDFVIRAYAASKMRNKIPLHIFGQECSSYTKALASLARQLCLDQNLLVFHQGVSGDQLIEEYRRSRLVLSGSHTECQPLALLDANATGTPFIARSTGCINKMPGGIGVQNWQEMAHRMDDLENNTALWQHLSKAGHDAAREIYHPDRTMQKLVSCFAQ